VKALRRLVLAVLLVLGAACATLSPPASTDVVSVPDAVDGSCRTDVTTALQSLIDRAEQHGTLRLTPGACYRAEQPLTIDHAVGFTLDGAGATIRRTQAGPDDGSARTRMVFHVTDSTDVVVRSLTILGPHPESGRGYDANYEAQHGFWLDGVVRGFRMQGSTIYGVWGDGVYVAGAETTMPDGVSVIGNRLELIGRQGVAVVAGRNVVVANNTFARVARSVLDLEPLSTRALVDGVQLTDNRIEKSNRFVAALSSVPTPVDNVQVLRNVLVDTPMILNVVSPGFSGTGPSWRQHWTIDGNQSMTLPQGGHIVWLVGVLDLRLTNNRWRVLDRPGPSPELVALDAPWVVAGNVVTKG
jgi:hypothetical protein